MKIKRLSKRVSTVDTRLFFYLFPLDKCGFASYNVELFGGEWICLQKNGNAKLIPISKIMGR